MGALLAALLAVSPVTKSIKVMCSVDAMEKIFEGDQADCKTKEGGNPVCCKLLKKPAWKLSCDWGKCSP